MVFVRQYGVSLDPLLLLGCHISKLKLKTQINWWEEKDRERRRPRDDGRSAPRSGRKEGPCPSPHGANFQSQLSSLCSARASLILQFSLKDAMIG